MLRTAGVLCLLALAFTTLGATTATAEDAVLDAVLSYVGPGPDGHSVYRYDYTLTNNSVTPVVIELFVFFDSDPETGTVFLGDNSDFNNMVGFTGSVTAPTGWLADAYEDPDPSAWMVDFFNFDGSNAIAPGGSLSGFSVTFLWKGEGLPGAQFFEALNGWAHEGSSNVTYNEMAPITGVVTSDCAGDPLSGVLMALYNSAGDLITTVVTGPDGSYVFDMLPPETYTVAVATPLGYEDHLDQAVIPGAPVDFLLVCKEIQCAPRTIGFWKHQANVHFTGRGKAQTGYGDFLGMLDAIYEHYALSPVNPVLVYTVPPTASDDDKLQAARTILTVNGSKYMNLRARQQLLALVLNVASVKLGQGAIVSADGATASQAITHAWDLIADAYPANDELAKDIADYINNGRVVPAGWIPLGTPNYTYEEPGTDIAAMAGRTRLLPAYPNPVRAAGTEIRFELAQPGAARLEVFDVQGRLVRTLLDGRQAAGEVAVRWDGRGDSGGVLATGVYFYRLSSEQTVETKKLLLAK